LFVCNDVFFSNQIFKESIDDFINLIFKVIPILFVVFILMIVSNIYLTNEIIKKWFTETKGIKGWILIVIAGFISAGPPYLWYPLLADMKKKGMKEGFIACFIYTRAIKPYFLPVLILYFGIKYTIVLSFIMIISGILLGIIFNTTQIQNYLEKGVN
jgi:uncharacterized membrane protein YraQ (UPF0718 family)